MNETIKWSIEEGGERWEAAGIDRQKFPVLVALSERPTTLFEVSLESGARHPHWNVREREATESERLDVCGMASCGLGRIGSLTPIGGCYALLRAYVCNTRASGSWLPSVEFVEVEIRRRG
jgi:hypothetical protein